MCGQAAARLEFGLSATVAAAFDQPVDCLHQDFAIAIALPTCSRNIRESGRAGPKTEESLGGQLRCEA